MFKWICIVATMCGRLAWATSSIPVQYVPIAVVNGNSESLVKKITTSIEHQDAIQEEASFIVLIDTSLSLAIHSQIANQIAILNKKNEVSVLLRGYPNQLSNPKIAPPDEMNVNEKLNQYISRGVGVSVDPEQYKHWESEFRKKGISDYVPALVVVTPSHVEAVIGSLDVYWSIAKVMDSSEDKKFKETIRRSLRDQAYVVERAYP